MPGFFSTLNQYIPDIRLHYDGLALGNWSIRLSNIRLINPLRGARYVLHYAANHKAFLTTALAFLSQPSLVSAKQSIAGVVFTDGNNHNYFLVSTLDSNRFESDFLSTYKKSVSLLLITMWVILRITCLEIK
jgi:hypothetical protein